MLLTQEIINIAELNYCPDCFSEDLLDLLDEVSGEFKGIMCNFCTWVYLVEHGVINNVG